MTKAEFCRLHLSYRDILETELERFPPVPQEVTQVLGQSDGSADSEPVPETVRSWLDLLDLAVSPHRLRRYGQESGLDELTIQALLRFLVGKNMHTQVDREKVDLSSPEKIVQVEIIGKEAGVSLLAPGDVLDVAEVKGRA